MVFQKTYELHIWQPRFTYELHMYYIPRMPKYIQITYELHIYYILRIRKYIQNTYELHAYYIRITYAVYVICV